MPKLLKTPFAIDAAEGFRTDIQESTGAAPNSATYQVGFPPVTMQSIASNGMPPKGSDLNGVLYDITDNLVFLTQGGGYGFDSAYATSIGGYPLNARLRLANGDIVKSTVDGNTNDPNVDMTGWVNPEEKLKPKKILLQDYVLPAHNSDASLALSLAIADAKLKSSCTIDFEFYEYDFKTLVNESNLNNIKLDASDAVIKNSTGLSEVIRLSNCSNTRWVLDVVEGIETLARHTTIGANFYYFLRFVNSKNCRVHSGYSKSIRSLVEFYDCTACKAYDNYHEGFLPEIAEAQIANSNYLPFITFNGGRHNLAWGNHAENHGSDVLWGREAFATIAFGNSGKHLHDNGIYGSSGNNSISFGNSFDYVRGTGIKPRGSRNLAIGNTLSNAYTGVSSTGNGVTVDSLGANGFGNIVAFNAIDKSVNYSVSVGDQDGLYSRGAIVAFNTASDHLGTGAYSPYRVSTTHACVTVGNILDEHNADIGFLVTGLANRSLNNSGVFALNSGHTTKPLVRSTYGQNSVYLGNVNSNGQGVQFRYQLNSVAAGNNALTQAVAQSDTYLSENMLYVANGGVATNLTNATTIVEGNANAVQTISSTTLLPPPKRANIIARDEVGAPYISVLIGSSYSWKKITVT